MISRRGFLKGVAVSFAMSAGRFFEPKYIFGMDFIGPKGLPEGTLRESVIAVLPGKKPLIKRSYRPPNYETPVKYFNDIFTPNDVFFCQVSPIQYT
jgi:hypothetical protein